MISFPYIFFLSAHMPPLFGDYQTSLPFIHSNKTSPRLDLIDYQPITKKKKKIVPVSTLKMNMLFLSWQQ